MNLIDRLGYAVDSTCMGFINAGVEVKKVAWVVGEGGSRYMYEVYSLQGFEKWCKAATANMRAVELIFGCKGLFSSCMQAVEAQKELIYATLFFESTRDFIYIDPDSGEMSGTLPRDERTGNIDWVKLLYGIGNPLDTLCFLHRYEVVTFPFFEKVAAQVGEMKMFTLHGEAWKFGDIPFLNTLVIKPKDFFVCLASIYSTYKCFKNRNFWDIDNLIKLTGSIGKIVLITSADYMVRKKYFVLLTIIDVVTQNAGLIKLLRERSKKREDRFNDPTSF